MLDEDVARELRRLGHDVVKVSEIGLASASPFLERSADRDFQNRLVIVKLTGVRWIQTG